jgi:hypothetical protein
MVLHIEKVVQFITENKTKNTLILHFHQTYVPVQSGRLSLTNVVTLISLTEVDMSLTEVVTLISLTEVTLPGIPQDRVASKLLPQNSSNLWESFLICATTISPPKSMK